MVYDVYVWGRLVSTYQSLNKANAALYRHDPRGLSRIVSFVKARAPKPGNRAPTNMRRRAR